MPSTIHEALVHLFRDRPDMALELLQQVLHVQVPAHDRIRVSDSNLNHLAPPEYHADLVLYIEQAGQTVLTVVIEPQLAKDQDKLYSWPVYECTARARLRCSACVLVVTPSAEVARWADRWIRVGPYSRSRPLVLGPRNFPRITDVEVARAIPELAILSALMHARRRGALDVAYAGAVAADGLDGENAAVYYDLIVGGLGRVAAKALEAMMLSHNHEWKSEFARKYVALGEASGKAEGKIEGKIESLLTILSVRGVALTEAERERITRCTDVELLERWTARAATASTTDEVFVPSTQR